MPGKIVDLNRRRAANVPAPPSPEDLLTAAQLVRNYAQRLFHWSQRSSGAADVACGNMCCFADCIDREAQALAEREGVRP